MKVLLALLTIALLGAAQGCRWNPTGHQNLDFSMYHGRWYLLETGPVGTNDSRPLDCVYESYEETTSPVVFNMLWHGQTTVGEVVDDTGLVTLPDLSMKSTMDVFIDGTVFHSKILATDYSTWAIEYSCHDGLGWERFMIRSRSATISQEVRTTLHNLINSYGVNAADFAVVRHQNCVT